MATLQLKNPCGLASLLPLSPLRSGSSRGSLRNNRLLCRAQIDQVNNNLSKFWNEKSIHLAALLATVSVEQPALAVTGVNNEEDLVWVLIQIGIIAFLYFLVAPPIIMNWLRIRWYRRNLLEMYMQFMFVFLFFPGVLLWAPFLNFRKFPRDPSMKYPWSVPEDPNKIKNAYLKFPYAQPEDYE